MQTLAVSPFEDDGGQDGAEEKAEVEKKGALRRRSVRPPCGRLRFPCQLGGLAAGFAARSEDSLVGVRNGSRV